MRRHPDNALGAGVRDAEYKQLVGRLLAYHGFGVTWIRKEEHRNGHRPDLAVSKNGETFTIELNRKMGGGRGLNGCSRPGGGNGRHHRPPANGCEGGHPESVRSAQTQTNALALGLDTFRIIWVPFEGEDAALQLERARARLFGTITIADCGPEAANSTEPFSLGPEASRHRCYYFAEGYFSRHRCTVDAVVLSRPGRLLLCVNSLSPRARRFRASALARAFSESLLDPDRWEKSKIAFILDDKMDRTNPAICLGYLQKKYRTGRLVVLGDSQPGPGTLHPVPRAA